MTLQEILNYLSENAKDKLIIINGDCLAFVIKDVKEDENIIYLDVDEFKYKV